MEAINNTTKRADLMLSGASVRFKNFSGTKSEYNAAGNRNVCVDIPIDMVDKLKAEGWNIRERPAKNEGDDPIYYTAVNVNYKGMYPPKVYMVEGTVKTLLTEETISLLDTAYIDYVDAVIHPFVYIRRGDGAECCKGYVRTMYCVIKEAVADPFATKYNFEETEEENPF